MRALPFFLPTRHSPLATGSSPLTTQKGVALIGALLMVALATVAAVAMASRQQLDIRRTTNALEYDQAYLYLMEAEDFAGLILKSDFQNQKQKYDSLDEEWAMRVPPIPVEGGQIAGSIEDMQGRFNINSLCQDAKCLAINSIALERFQRLLTTLQLPVEFADALADWLDENDDVRMGGAEQVYYMGLQPPYRAFNGQMASVSELRLVKGMTPEIYATLEPYVAALPFDAKLNVNTIPKDKPALVICLAANIPPTIAAQVLEDRGVAGHSKVSEFVDDTPLRDFGIDQTALTVSSSYFMVTSHVQVGSSTFTTFSLLMRDQAGATHTVRRAQGTY